MHRATGDTALAGRGRQDLTDEQIALFWDDRVGGFFLHLDAARTVVRPQQAAHRQRDALGQFGVCGNLLYLAAALDKPEYAQRAEVA